MLFKYKIILASGSPRRRELITYLFNNTEFLKYACDEPVWIKGQNAGDYLRTCLEVKWKSALNAVSSPPHALLLVADTIVVQGQNVLGKPRNAQDAERMLGQLSARPHLVQTGFRIGKLESPELFLDRTVESRVSFRTLSKKEIRDYVRSKEPMDKAGAYGFQGIGMQNIARIEGSYTNIVGLPLAELRRATQELGVR